MNQHLIPKTQPVGNVEVRADEMAEAVSQLPLECSLKLGKDIKINGIDKCCDKILASIQSDQMNSRLPQEDRIYTFLLFLEIPIWTTFPVGVPFGLVFLRLNPSKRFLKKVVPTAGKIFPKL